LNRLKTVNEPSGRYTLYGYDAAGNRDEETVTVGAEVTTKIYESTHDRIKSSVLYSSSVNSKDKELMEHLLFRYNDNDKNYGKETYKYYEEFIRYYDILDRNKVK
jgi:YD repeat-containing protein